jgi:hypothetical protein
VSTRKRTETYGVIRVRYCPPVAAPQVRRVRTQSIREPLASGVGLGSFLGLGKPTISPSFRTACVVSRMANWFELPSAHQLNFGTATYD